VIWGLFCSFCLSTLLNITWESFIFVFVYLIHLLDIIAFSLTIVN
jgi:hypothetical protein